MKAHYDDVKNWSQLSLDEHLNAIVDGMAKKVLITAVVEHESISSKFPFKKMRVEMNDTKVTGSPRAALEHHWGYTAAKEFNHSKRMINKYEFQLVWWDVIEKTMVGFPKMFRVFVTNQTSFFVVQNDSCHSMIPPWRMYAPAAERMTRARNTSHEV